MRRVLAYEQDWYLRARAGERGVEPPRALVERQDYVYYHKGALAMYALRDAVDEVRLNEALKRYLSRFALGGPPYSTTADLLEEIRPTVPEGWEHLVEDLFERITMFNNKVAAATFTEPADGTFLVRIELEAHKRRGDGAGVEREIPIDDWMDIAVFGDEADSKGRDSVLFLERRRIRASPVAFEIVVDQRPARVAIDPYYKLIDRDRGDNVRAVLSAGERDSGERRRVEERQVVVEPVHFGPGLLPPASDVEVVVEQLPADLLDGAAAAGDPARVDVDQVGPALGELGASTASAATRSSKPAISTSVTAASSSR